MAHASVSQSLAMFSRSLRILLPVYSRLASITAYLTRLLTKDQFEWSPEAQQAFIGLKDAFTIAPILFLPDFTLPFTLETDMSSVEMGAVLSLKEHPIAFFSKPLVPSYFEPPLTSASSSLSPPQ